jgi:PKD repeat protein
MKLFKMASIVILFGWVNISLANFSVLPCVGEKIPLTLNLNAGDSYDVDGQIVSYRWFASNGQRTEGKYTSLTFTQPGDYEITLTVTDEKEAKSKHTQNIAICGGAENVSEPPTAKIAIIPDTSSEECPVILDGTDFSSAIAKCPVILDGTTSSPAIDGTPIVEYAWFISEEQTFEKQTFWEQTAFGHTATLIFPNEGTYTVKLVVTDDNGNTNLAEKIVDITPSIKKAPSAEFRVIPTSGSAPLDITLDASKSSDPDGIIREYTWTIRQEETDQEEKELNGEQTNDTLEMGGSYTVTLTVTDNDGIESTATDTVTVIPGITENEIAELEFVGLKNFYKVGQTVVVTLREKLNIENRSEKVDLWVQVKLPPEQEGNILYRTSDDPLKPFSTTHSPFKTDLQTSNKESSIFNNLEVIRGIGGEYKLSAVYVQTGKNPFKDGIEVWRSELVTVKTHLGNQ